MKISIELEKDGEEDVKEMPKPVTPFQRKVARMLAKMAGRKTPNAKDMEMASEVEQESEEDKA